jgi:hypothetical protein
MSRTNKIWFPPDNLSCGMMKQKQNRLSGMANISGYHKRPGEVSYPGEHY